MQVSYASAGGSPDVENQDHVLAGERLICVLDGVTPPATGVTGCTHGVRWYVETLARSLAARAARANGLPEVLAQSIDQVLRAHDGICDLRHPDTPSAAVALFRTSALSAEYLVLCDCAIVLERGTGVSVFTDATRPPERERRMSAAGPLWKASVVPEAAFSAVAGSVPLNGADGLRRAGIMTDGVTRAVLSLGVCTWSGLVEHLASRGPRSLISAIRAAEDSQHESRADRPRKKHDDATAVICEIVHDGLEG
ncbi:protein phosphatase 2C domain-containing protein [Nonomuraea sp. NPDC046802]|uniref:protein phosphatase 2C domain-containing protein n=1 Tax=Nonomuraea sp. NPDC046802 TaxID=3154919 RepID=UPI0033C956E2